MIYTIVYQTIVKYDILSFEVKKTMALTSTDTNFKLHRPVELYLYFGLLYLAFAGHVLRGSST